jgi:hypothetical protein
MKPKKHETGAGTAPYMFKTDVYGNGNHSASLSSQPFGKWQMIMVVLHPDGNPKKMHGGSASGNHVEEIV